MSSGSDGIMLISAIRLPKTETFACSRKNVTKLFLPDELAWVSLGKPIRTFSSSVIVADAVLRVEET